MGFEGAAGFAGATGTTGATGGGARAGVGAGVAAAAVEEGGGSVGGTEIKAFNWRNEKR